MKKVLYLLPLALTNFLVHMKKTRIINFRAKLFKTFLEILCISILPHLILLIKRLRSTYVHHLSNLDSTGVPCVSHNSSRSSVNWFWRRISLKVLSIYEHDGLDGRMAQLICISFHSHFPQAFT